MGNVAMGSGGRGVGVWAGFKVVGLGGELMWGEVI